MTILITLICLALALAIFAGAFYLARYVVALQSRTAAYEAELKRAEEHIDKVEQLAEGLQQEIDFMRNERARNTQEITNRAWNPSDPLNSTERM